MTKEFTKDKINELSEKLLFKVNDNEIDIVLNELEFLKEQINNITKIEELKEVEPQTHAFDLFASSLREDDNFEEGTDLDLLLRNAKKTENGEIEVPKVVG